MTELNKLRATLPGKEVDPAGIEQALRKEFKDAAGRETDSESVQGSTVLSNIVLFVPSFAKFERNLLLNFIQDLCISHPSRVFVVSLDDSEEVRDKILSSVLSRCFIANNSTHTCSEEVFILAGEDSLDLVASLLLSLLVPDVQTKLCVFNPNSGGKNAFSNCALRERILSFLQANNSIVQKLVFDSSLVANTLAGFSDISSCLDENKLLSISDMAWGRSRRYREIIKEQFELPELQDSLDDLKEVLIEHKQAETEARLLAGWFASSLRGDTTLTFTPETEVRGEITSFTLKVAEIDSPEQIISRVSLTFSSEVSLEITAEKENMFHVVLHGKGQHDLSRLLPAGRERGLLCELTESGAKSEIYQNSLNAFIKT